MTPRMTIIAASLRHQITTGIGHNFYPLNYNTLGGKHELVVKYAVPNTTDLYFMEVQSVSPVTVTAHVQKVVPAQRPTSKLGTRYFDQNSYSTSPDLATISTLPMIQPSWNSTNLNGSYGSVFTMDNILFYQGQQVDGTLVMSASNDGVGYVGGVTNLPYKNSQWAWAYEGYKGGKHLITTYYDPTATSSIWTSTDCVNWVEHPRPFPQAVKFNVNFAFSNIFWFNGEYVHVARTLLNNVHSYHTATFDVYSQRDSTLPSVETPIGLTNQRFYVIKGVLYMLNIQMSASWVEEKLDSIYKTTDLINWTKVSVPSSLGVLGNSGFALYEVNDGVVMSFNTITGISVLYGSTTLASWEKITIPPYIERAIFPLTYDELDKTSLINLIKTQTYPLVTPKGLEGDGWGAVLKTTTLPTSLIAATLALTLHASVQFPNHKNKSSSTLGDAVVFMGANTVGLNPNPKLALTIRPEASDDTRSYLAVTTHDTALKHVPVTRPNWKYENRFPVLSIDGYGARPQALIFLDANTVAISAHYQDTKTVFFKVDINTWQVLGQFTIDVDHLHIGAIAKNANGDYWATDYTTGKMIRIDLITSFNTNTPVITAVWDTSVLNKVSAIEFITVSSVEYAVIGEYATAGTPYVYIITSSQMVNGGVFAVASRYKRFALGTRIQGLALKSGHLWVAKNTDMSTTITKGWVYQHLNFATTVASTADGATLTPAYGENSASPYPEDIKFHPTTGRMWTMSEGWAATGDYDGFLSIWSSAVDGSSQENHVTARYDGQGSLSIKINNKPASTIAVSPSTDVAALSIGGLPNVDQGIQNGYFMGYVKNVCVQNANLTDYANVTSGSFESSVLTEYPLNITNGGAESGVTGWTNETGGLGVRTTNPLPFEGSAYFDGGANLQTIARQRKLLSDLGVSSADIDAGKVWVKGRWAQNNFNSINDPGGCGIRTLNGSQVQQTLTYSPIVATPNIGNVAPQPWYTLAHGAALASGVRYTDFIIRSDRNSGTNNDSYFDAISMVAYRK